MPYIFCPDTAKNKHTGQPELFVLFPGDEPDEWEQYINFYPQVNELVMYMPGTQAVRVPYHELMQLLIPGSSGEYVSSNEVDRGWMTYRWQVTGYDKRNQFCIMFDSITFDDDGTEIRRRERVFSISAIMMGDVVRIFQMLAGGQPFPTRTARQQAAIDQFSGQSHAVTPLPDILTGRRQPLPSSDETDTVQT